MTSYRKGSRGTSHTPNTHERSRIHRTLCDISSAVRGRRLTDTRYCIVNVMKDCCRSIRSVVYSWGRAGIASGIGLLLEPLGLFQKETDARCYASATAYAMIIPACNACSARLKRPTHGQS